MNAIFSNMKHLIKKLLFILTLLTAFFCFNVSKEKTDCAIELIQHRTMYLGVENDIKVVSSNVVFSELNVSVDNGIITGESGLYSVRPERSGTVTVSIYQNDCSIYKVKYNVKELISPNIVLYDTSQNYFYSGLIKRSNIKNIIGLKFVYPNSDFQCPLKILSFELIEDGEKNGVFSNNDLFGDKEKKYLNSLQDGDLLYITNIMAQGPDSTIRQLGSLNFRIRD